MPTTPALLPHLKGKGVMYLSRVERCADLMRRHKFKRGKTIKALAAEWGISLTYAHEISADASKLVLAELGDPDRVKVSVLGTLEDILARARRDSMHADPEVRARAYVATTQAAKTLALLAGAGAPTRVEVTSRESGEAWSPLSPDPQVRRTQLQIVIAHAQKLLAVCDRELGIDAPQLGAGEVEDAEVDE